MRQALYYPLNYRLVTAIVVALCVYWNWRFVLPQAQNRLLRETDVPSLVKGFYDTPHLWPDSLRWWHGTWQYPGAPRFRPVSAYLYWYECWIGLRYGWLWTGLVNFALFVACCLITTKIAHRFTGSLWAALVAGGLAAAVHYFNSGVADWLIWFPNAYNLLTASLWLGALLTFDRWHEGSAGDRRARWLLATWALFLGACLSLESAWMFPAMALLIAVLRPTSRPRWQSLLQGTLMCGAVGFLMWYRAHVIPGSALPNSNSTNFGSIFFYTHPLVTTIVSGDWPVLGLCALIGLLSIGQIRQRVLRGMRRVAGPVVWIGVAAIAAALLFLLYAPAIYFIYRLFYELPAIAVTILYVLSLPLGVFLLWRYGRQLGRTWLVALCLPPLAFLPTLPYMHAHWHYTFTPWFFLCIFYGTMAHLLELHLRQLVSAPDGVPSRGRLANLISRV